MLYPQNVHIAKYQSGNLAGRDIVHPATSTSRCLRSLPTTPTLHPFPELPPNSLSEPSLFPVHVQLGTLFLYICDNSSRLLFLFFLRQL